MAQRGRRGRTGARRKPRREESRRRSRHLDGVNDIDTNNHELLRQFVTEHGKIIPARLTGASAKQQRQIKHGVRKARVIGMIA